MPLPEEILFVDVETTGLTTSDRIVSLGFICLSTAPLQEGTIDLKFSHFIFDPGRNSHPKAEEVHGYSDWVLRHQDPFEAKAADLKPLFDKAGLIVAHNAVFDQRFIENEFAMAGHALMPRPYFCTMQAYREKIGGRSGLNAVLAEIGLARTGKTHGALEDAWMAMMVFLWLHNLPRPGMEHMPQGLPDNWKNVPPLPEGRLPRRKSRVKKSSENAHANTDIRARLIKAARPMAVLIMWVARSDELVSEEISVLQQMVRSVADSLGLPENSQFEQDVAADLCELEPTPEMVDAAARAIARDETSRSQLGNWIGMVTYADGKGTEAEQLAISCIHEALARANKEQDVLCLDSSQKEAVLSLIQLLEVSTALTAEEISNRRVKFSREKLHLMRDKGMSDGEASSALAFLRQDDVGFRAHLRKIDNDLSEQVKIVQESFVNYLECGEIPAPYYASRIAIILRKLKEKVIESRFLAAWCRHFPSGPGQTYVELFERAQKLGAIPFNRNS